MALNIRTKILKAGKKEIRNLKTLWILNFIAVGIILMLSGNVNAYSSDGTGICYCGDGNISLGGDLTDACVDCSAALNDNINCRKEVRYAGIIAIGNYSATCIYNPQNFNNKIFDCQGHTIDGDGKAWNGIYLNRKIGNIIKNCVITDFDAGIYLDSSSNNILINNTMKNNGHGIYLDSSSNNILINNTMKNNEWNFDIDGEQIFHFYQNIDTSNLVNDKPIYYWTNKNNAPNNCRNAEINETTNAGFVALVSCNNITIRNLNLRNNSYGILLVNTTNSRILNNTINSNYNGIWVYYSSNNLLINNAANNNDKGIYLHFSSNNILINNTAKNNNYNGIYLFFSSNNTLTNNTMKNNKYNFVIHGEQIFHFYQNIDTSNLVNDKPIYYWTNKNNAPNNCRNAEINETTNAGFVALVSCNNITIRNLNLRNNNYYGVLLVNTTNSKILNNTANSNKNGIYLHYSLNNIIINNTANNNPSGIRLFFSSNNALINNTANNNTYGIYLDSSSNNALINNTANNNWNGISLDSSSNNTLIDNTAHNNTYGIYLGHKNNNITIIANNVCYNSEYDVYNEGKLVSIVGDNNTCVTSYNYNDADTVGCKYYVCLIDDCNCSTCEECNYKLSHPSCLQVSLIANIINQAGTCINNPRNFNNKIFDCQGHVIDGNESGLDYGIYLHGKINNTIKNCIVTDFIAGIFLFFSSNNTLINNIANNNIYNGIHLRFSSNNTLINNTVNNNTLSGIYLFSSSNNTLTNNTMKNNKYNFVIHGEQIFHFYQNIDTSNLVNDKPIYYWTNKNNAPNNCRNAEINETTNAGFVALVSCNNITIRNLNLRNNNYYGVLLVNTTNSKILNNAANSNMEGISLYTSSNNTLINNTANNNSFGISLFFSSNNTLINNIANNNMYNGIHLHFSSNNTLIHNTANLNQGHGLYVTSYSINITINSNTFCSNNQMGENYSDIYVYDLNTTTGNNNTCDTTYNYNDVRTTRCKNKCQINKATEVFDIIVEILNSLFRQIINWFKW